MGHLINASAASCLLFASVIQAEEPVQGSSWSPNAMIQTKMISDIQISPNNESVLFVMTEPKFEEEKGTSLSRIYKASCTGGKTPVPFSAAQVSSMQPRWSPDGKSIAFLSTREGVKKLYLLSCDGGEAIALTDDKKNVGVFSWSPDGKKIALVMSDEKESARNEKKTSLAYIHNHSTTVNRLWLIDVFSSDPSPKPLTSDEYCVRGNGDFGTINTEFDWSPDSKKITFSYSPSIDFDVLHLDSSLATIDLITGVTISLEKHANFEAMPRYSADGQSIAFVSGNSPQKYAINRQVAVMSSEGTQYRLLPPTFEEGAYVAGPNLLGWTQDGKSILYFEPKETKFHIMLLPVDGSAAKELNTGEVFFQEPTLSYDRTMLGFVAQTPIRPPEGFVAKIDEFVPVQLSSFNDQFLSYPIIDTETVSWTSSDGLKIEGLLTYPLNYDKTKQYPLLLVIHGGPMGFFDESFLGTPDSYPIASFAQAGFMVFRPNPRGSSGYGKDFRCANYNDWAGADYNDIISGVDSLIDQGIVDSEKLGVMGWSYGGFMTAWIITQTSRFKAASLGAGFYNLASMNGTSDLVRFMGDYLGNHSDNKDLYESRSPINYVQKITTPCLIQHGTDDKRVPVSQAYEFYNAMNRLEKETLLILYPGMEHGLSDPKMQLDAMERNLAWFQKHLTTP